MQDSTDKIITTYFACLTEKEFSYEGKIYTPKRLVVSENIFRKFLCPKDCGGCCKNYTMDWLPDEKPDMEHVKERKLILNNQEFPVFSDIQDGITGYYCRYVEEEHGRCTIHTKRAMSCDFEPLRFKIHPDGPANYFGSYPYGRGWAMKRVDGVRGARCMFAHSSDASRRDVLRKLRRLREWTDYFKLETKLPKIIDYLDNCFKPKQFTI